MLALLFAVFTSTFPVELVDCYDGDTCTFNILVESSTEKVGFDMEVVTLVKLVGRKARLCDIQAPEIRPLKTREAATQSRDALLALLQDARVLSIEVFGKDNFGRVLVRLYADGVSVNERMIHLGHAVPYKKRCN